MEVLIALFQMLQIISKLRGQVHLHHCHILVVSFISVVYLLISISEIDEAEAREALLNFVADKCCYGKSAAADLQILKIAHTCALHVSMSCNAKSVQ